MYSGITISIRFTIRLLLLRSMNDFTVIAICFMGGITGPCDLV